MESSPILRDNYIGDLTPLAHLKHLASISAISYSGPASEIPLIQVSSAQPLAEATLNGSSVVLKLLRAGTSYDVSTDNIRNALTVSGIDGVTVSDITRMSDTEVEATLEFTGNFDAITMLTFTLAPEAVSGFDARALTGAIRVYPEGGITITASTAHPLTGATLNEAQVELTISHALFKSRDNGLKTTLSRFPVFLVLVSKVGKGTATGLHIIKVKYRTCFQWRHNHHRYAFNFYRGTESNSGL